MEYPEDYDLIFRMYRASFKVVAIPKVTLNWREHPDRTSRNSDHYSQASFFELKILRFIQMEMREDRILFLWGKNQKSKLTSQILARKSIDFIHSDLDSYQDISGISKPLLLIAIYPESGVRQEIELYLNTLNLVRGKDFWYL